MRECYVTFNKSERFKDFKIATTYLNKEISKLVSNDKFIAGYELSDYNINNPTRFQVTVHAERAVYDKLNGTNYEKGEWKERVLDVTSFWREPAYRIGVLHGLDSVFKSPVVDAMPEYPGGIDNFYKFIGQNFRYPRAAIEAGVSGRMVASFVIEKDGSITDVVITKDLGYGTGEALTKLLESSDKWKPGRIYDAPVRVQYTLPVMLHAQERGRKSSFRNPSIPPEYSLLPEKRDAQEIRLSAVSATRLKYLFTEKLDKCTPGTFIFEEEKIALSDRYSVLQMMIDAVPKDSLKNVTGRISLQALIDTTGTACLLSQKNEISGPSSAMRFSEAISKTKWSLYPAKGSKKEPVSVILILTFTANQVKYQHMAFKPGSDDLTELEITTRGKFSKY